VKRKLAIGALVMVGAVLAFAIPAAAQEADPLSAEAMDAALRSLLNNVWVFIAGILVFLMQAGFAFVEAGLTRGKNVSNIMAKNLADMCIGVLAFFAIGFGIAYGTDSGNIIGTDTFFLSGAVFGVDDGLSIFTDFFFQVVFAATAVTIASGAMAERTKIAGYLIFSAAMTGFIYPMVVHSFWGGGLIAQLEIGDARFGDFAGSTIVHSAGGWAALMGALILGPRIGRYGKDGKPRAIPGHNIAFVVIGVFILWFGWFGFNPGSELAADEVVMRAGVTTLLAAAAGGFTAGAVIWMKSKALDVAMTANGVLAGLVGITAGTATMNTAGALITGAVAGALVVFAVLFFDRIRIDDPVGAISVHGVCGVWGTLAVGLFARYGDGFVATDDAGLFYGGGLDQLAVQAIGVVMVFAWVVATTGLLFLGLKKVGLLRVSPEEEMEGLDTIEHGTPGYHEDVLSHEAAPGSYGTPVYEKV
jgi:Amt family ammonium transporter